MPCNIELEAAIWIMVLLLRLARFLSSVIFKGEVKDPRQVVAKLVLLYSLMMSWGIDEIVWEPLRSGITLGMAQDLAAEQLREKDENGDSCAQELGRAT